MSESPKSPYNELFETRILILLEIAPGINEYRQILFTEEQKKVIIIALEASMKRRDKDGKLLVKCSESVILMPSHLKSAYTPDEIAGEI